MVRIWVASLHQELQRCYDVGVSVLFGVYNALQGWMRTASTRRTVRRGKKPLWGFFRCAARVIHPRPPRLQRCYDAGVSVLSGLYNALQGWMRTASTRRTVRREKSPCGAFLDARLATSTRAHQKSSTYESALNFLFCTIFRRTQRVDENSYGAVAKDSAKTALRAVFSSAAHVIHPRPPRNST